MTTVNPVQSSTYNLSSANNPITFGSMTEIINAFSAGVYGDTTANWTVSNQGEIVGVSGFILFSDSMVTNGGVVVAWDTTGVGIDLQSGGMVSNQAAGTIIGNQGVVVFNSGDVTNAGVISGGGNFGIGVIVDNGDVTNKAGGTIWATGMGVDLASGSVNNAGVIQETATSGQITGGVVLQSGGEVTNSAGGSISGYAYGVWARTRSATVNNAGTIGAASAASTGVYLANGGSVFNLAGGAISGGIGAQAVGVIIGGGPGSLTNAGTISGTQASVELFGSGANALTLETGSVLIGDVICINASSAFNMLVLSGAGSAGDSFVNFNALNVDASGAWTLGGVSSVGATAVASGVLVVTGALATRMTVDAGAKLQIGVGGSVTGGGTVSSGGTLELADSITSDGGLPLQPGVVSAPETVSGLTLLSGSILSLGIVISSGVTSSGLTVSSGGLVEVQSGGTASNLTVLSGGGLVDGGLARGTIVGNGGREVVLDAYDWDTTVLSGGVLFVSSGGWDRDATVSTGGSAVVSLGGIALTANIASGGMEFVLAGGLDSGAIVSAGGGISGPGLETGKLELLSGGTASGLQFASGAVDLAYGGSMQNKVTISSGATLELARRIFSAGQTVSLGPIRSTTILDGVNLLSGSLLATFSAVLSSGASEVVASGGTVAGGVVLSGARLTVLSGGAITRGLTLSGGTAVIAGTAAAGQTVSFSGSGGVLELDNVAAFSAQIAGLTNSTQKIDLGGFAYSSGETVAWNQTGTSGTLTVSDGGKVAHLILAGSYVTSNFTLSSDSHGGTYVVDPPIRANPAGFAQAMAATGGGSGTTGGAPYAAAGSASLIGAAPLLTAGATSTGARGG